MGSVIANIFTGIGNLFANSFSQACVLMFFDEPECPKSLIK